MCLICIPSLVLSVKCWNYNRKLARMMTTEEETPDTRTPVERVLGFRVVSLGDNDGKTSERFQLQYLNSKGKVTHVRPAVIEEHQMYQVIKRIRREV